MSNIQEPANNITFPFHFLCYPRTTNCGIFSTPDPHPIPLHHYHHRPQPHPPYSAHFGEVKHRLVAVVDTLGQQLGELLVVEDLERAAGRNLAHGGGVEAMVVVAVPGLDEDCRVREAFRVDLAAHVVKMDACRGSNWG